MISCRRYAVGGMLCPKNWELTFALPKHTQLKDTLHWNCHANSEKSKMISSVWNICDEFDIPVPLKDFVKSTFHA